MFDDLLFKKRTMQWCRRGFCNLLGINVIKMFYWALNWVLVFALLIALKLIIFLWNVIYLLSNSLFWLKWWWLQDLWSEVKWFVLLFKTLVFNFASNNCSTINVYYKNSKKLKAQRGLQIFLHSFLAWRCSRNVLWVLCFEK